MEEFRKNQRKKEAKRNKQLKEEARVAASILRDPKRLKDEIKRLEALQNESEVQDGAIAAKLKTLKEKRNKFELGAGFDNDLSKKLHAENFATIEGREIRIGGKNGVPLPPTRLLDSTGEAYSIPPPPPEIKEGEELDFSSRVPSPPPLHMNKSTRIIPAPPPIVPFKRKTEHRFKANLADDIQLERKDGEIRDDEEEKGQHAALIDVSKILGKGKVS